MTSVTVTEDDARRPRRMPYSDVLGFVDAWMKIFA